MSAVAYSPDLADRIRTQLQGVKRVTEQEMFGGLSFLVAGHICCGAYGEDLIVRVPPELHHDALVRPHVREMDMGGRSARGMVLVGHDGLVDDGDLQLWVRLGLARASALPPKPAKRVAKKGAVKKAANRVAPKTVKKAATAVVKKAAKKMAKTAAKKAVPQARQKRGR